MLLEGAIGEDGNVVHEDFDVSVQSQLLIGRRKVKF